MAATKILEGEVYCPRCKTFHGKIWKIETRDGFFENMTEPKQIPKYCSVCEGVLERK